MPPYQFLLSWFVGLNHRDIKCKQKQSDKLMRVVVDRASKSVSGFRLPHIISEPAASNPSISAYFRRVNQEILDHVGGSTLGITECLCVPIIA